MNKEEKYIEIKKYLTLVNYNKHTYYTPKWMKVFTISKSYKTEYAGKWTDEEVFDTCVEKIWDKLLIENNYEIQVIKDLSLIENEEWKLELISSLMQQIEYMVFNNTIIDSVNMNGFDSANITKGRVHSNFWYDEPYQRLWVIGFFTAKSLQEFIDLDYSQLATRKFILKIAKLVMENFEEQLKDFVDENLQTIAQIILNDENFINGIIDKVDVNIKNKVNGVKDPSGTITNNFDSYFYSNTNTETQEKTISISNFRNSVLGSETGYIDENGKPINDIVMTAIENAKLIDDNTLAISKTQWDIETLKKTKQDKLEFVDITYTFEDDTTIILKGVK